MESNPKNQENHGRKRTWPNPGKTGQEKLKGSRNLLPSTTTGARVLNKSHVRSMRPYVEYEDTVLVGSVWVKKYTKINIEKMKSGKS